MWNLEDKETILIEDEILYTKKNIKSNIVVTNKKIVIEKESGLFKKKKRVVDIIPLTDVKTYNDSVKIKNEKETVYLQTITRNISFSCSSVKNAKKVCEKIITARTGKNFYIRNKAKLKKGIKIAKEAKEIIYIVAPIVIGFLGKKKK